MNKIRSDSNTDEEGELEIKINSIESSILNKINEIKNEFYNQNSKNTFFKKTQKLDCAKEICKNIDIYEMIAESIFVVPQTNKIYIDYPMFKLYANPDNYDIIIKHVINTCNYLITYYGNFEIYINIEKFTVSAAERYKLFIQKYCDSCLKENTELANLMTKMFILNSPSVIELVVKIIKPIVDKNIINKVSFHKKEESQQIIKSLK